MANFPTIAFERRRTPNFQPLISPEGNFRLAIISDCPDEESEKYGMPLMGKSGNILDRTLADFGVDRRSCFVGQICQVRPPQNKISLLPWDSEEIQSGLTQLRNDLNTFNPNLCLLLGAAPLRAAKGGASISSWRGSLFTSNDINSIFHPRKCVATYHPSSVLRDWSGFPLFKFDIRRAVQESTTSILSLPQREIVTNLSALQLVHLLDTWPSGLRCSIDLEGGLPHDCANDSVKKDSKKRRHLGWRCVGLSPSIHKSYVIAWWKFNESEHALVLQAYARLMARTDVPKVLQNSMYDAFVQAYGYGIPMRNVAEDTMLKGWEVYSELPKGLATMASIYTREPHWKDEEMYESTGENLAIGCGKDTAVTLEICEVQDSLLPAPALAHYRTNVELLNPALYMELRGILLDQDSVAKKTNEIKNTGWTETTKRGETKVHKPISAIGDALDSFCGKSLRGPAGSLVSPRLIKVLYDDLGFPPQFKKDENTGQDKLTSDIEAILKLRKITPPESPKADFLNNVIRHRHLEGLLETLAVKPDPDGRVRCAYNIVGTETGRFSCKQSPTGAGANMTTITKALRYNYQADPGYDFAQCDLEGADGWTVAAHCNRLNDPTMMLDYLAGLKPAKIIGLLYAFGQEVNQLSREDLQFWCGPGWDSVLAEIGSWVYMGSKRVQHGTNYLMGIPTMIKQVMMDSFKSSGTPIYLEHSFAKQLQSNCYLTRYPGVETWHRWAEAQLLATGTLTAATGHTRVFFGPRYGPRLHDTVKEFLADEPQQNTTWATNLALLKLWNDPANRVSFFSGRTIKTCSGEVHYVPTEALSYIQHLQPGSLLIEPLHQVHDALCVQWPQFIRNWARKKMRTYFDNPLTIANQKITIPFDGTWGPSWGAQPNKL